jgi:hypothetical protein
MVIVGVMNFIGDLERAFATALYPNRVAIAILTMVGVIALVVVARRRGWLAAARRHPARTSLLVGAFLVVALPIGWYLGSPLLIRTELVEAAPTIAPAASAPTVPVPTARDRPATVEPDGSGAPGPDDSSPALAGARTGEFVGADEFHYGRGQASLLEVAPGRWIVRFESFSVRNGPDLYVYVSPDPTGYTTGAIELGRLEATDGSFNMEVPAGADPSAARSVVIWCKQFAVQFAVAALS